MRGFMTRSVFAPVVILSTILLRSGQFEALVTSSPVIAYGRSAKHVRVGEQRPIAFEGSVRAGVLRERAYAILRAEHPAFA